MISYAIICRICIISTFFSKARLNARLLSNTWFNFHSNENFSFGFHKKSIDNKSIILKIIIIIEYLKLTIHLIKFERYRS